MNTIEKIADDIAKDYTMAPSLAKRITAALEQERARVDTLERGAEMAAGFIKVIAEDDCSCESEGSWGPEFICGWHSCLFNIEDALGYELKEDEDENE